MNKNIILKYCLSYLVLVVIFTYYLVYNYYETKTEYLNNKTDTHFLNYQAIYDEHKKISNIIFETEINTPTILNLYKDAYKADELNKNIIREELFKKLSVKYKQLKNYNLKQLHFHLPDNVSFLRMHRPNKFGDDLTNIRQTVMYVNENKKYIEGFEEGRIFNGFRFVYPLSFDNKHIGSVEISFSALAFMESLHRNFALNGNFLIKKEIVEKKVFEDERKNYIQSPQEGFYYEKSIYEKFPPVSLNTKNEDKTSLLLKGKPFSFFIGGVNIIKTIIPLTNPISKKVVGAICICEIDSFIPHTKKNLLLMILLNIVFLGLIFYFFFKQRLANEKLKSINKDLDEKIKVEIEKSRKKDMHIQNHSRIIAIGDLLNNISHQWRQPLNVISTSATGLKLQKELKSLDDETFILLTDTINEKAQYLSKTIENFKNYLNDDDKLPKIFSIQERVDSALEVINTSLEYKQIKVEKKYDEEKLYITAKQGQFIQVIIHILNNAKDALTKNNDEENRKIFINIKEKEKNIALMTIEDNAGGISEEILPKIFEPYFTTKHKSQGTGIGLYMSNEIINKHIHGSLTVDNTSYIFEDSEFTGALFKISIPLI